MTTTNPTPAGAGVDQARLTDGLATARARLLEHAATTPALDRDQDREQAKRLCLAALDWIAAGEQTLPAPLAALPEPHRTAVLHEARQLGQLLRERVTTTAATFAPTTG